MSMQYTFSDFTLEQIFESMADPIANLNQRFQINALCGQIAGGRAMGLSGLRSDNDFDIFYKQTSGLTPPGLKYVEEIIINNKPVEVEFNLINLTNLEKAAKNTFLQKHNGYPTNFYRTTEEMEKFLPGNLLPRWEREEYFFTKFHTFIMGDNYWYGIAMSEHDMNTYYKMEKTIDALDYYFIRAYGNYKNYIATSSELLVRRYLNCIWQILSCEWILTYKTRPAMNINHLIEQIIDCKDIKKIVGKYYHLNCNSNMDKKELFCNSNKDLNEYIYKLLCRQKEKIENYNKNETIYELMLRTPITGKQKGYFIPI